MKYSFILFIACMALTACTGRGGALPEGTADDATVELITLSPAVIAEANQASQAAKPASPLLNETSPQNDYVYRLGKGDVLHAKMWVPSMENRWNSSMVQLPPQESGNTYNGLLIKPDGTITLPVVGEVAVGGMTLLEAKETIERALANYFRTSQLILEVVEFRSRKAFVTGAVAQPTDLALNSEPLRVLDAVKQAGGTTPQSDLRSATLTRANGEVVPVDMAALMQRGDMQYNYYLNDGDTLSIPLNHTNKLFVLGEVTQPGMLPLQTDRITLMEALTRTEGLDKNTASYEHLYVIRGAVALSEDGTAAQPAPLLTTKVFHADGTTATGLALAAQFPLEPMDVVYVSPTRISQWGKMVSQLIPSNVGSIIAAGIWTN